MRDGRVRVVVGGHVDGLERDHVAVPGGGDALLELRQVGGERRLVADARRHAPEQARHLHAGLHVAVHVVDDEEHVAPLDVAEVLGDRERGEADEEARTGRLLHLAEDQHGAIHDAAPSQLLPELEPLARALADSGEDRDARERLDGVVDELREHHGLADARAAEHRGAPAVRRSGRRGRSP